jgi:hypothetical protein
MESANGFGKCRSGQSFAERAASFQAMRKKPRIRRNCEPEPGASRPAPLDRLERLAEETPMIAQTEGANPACEESEESGAKDLYLDRSESFWWPYRAVAKALLRTQDNSLAYIEANRRLIDAMRNILRKEQDLAFEISEAVLAVSRKSGLRTADEAPSQANEVNEAFDRAMSGIRELGEAWIDAQVRSLDTIRGPRETPREKDETPPAPQAEAA